MNEDRVAYRTREVAGQIGDAVLRSIASARAVQGQMVETHLQLP